MFYVSVKDGSRYGLLLGPLASKEEAEARVGEVKELAEKADPFACFYAYGVSRWKGEPDAAPKGKLNELVEEVAG